MKASISLNSDVEMLEIDSIYFFNEKIRKQLSFTKKTFLQVTNTLEWMRDNG